MDGRPAAPEMLRHLDDAVEAYVEALGRMFPDLDRVAYRTPELDTLSRRYFMKRIDAVIGARHGELCQMHKHIFDSRIASNAPPASAGPDRAAGAG